ncbi:J domain-containing protein [Nonomuraea sp. SYSU D8015]|uniref:J domain-containing protein n=1 Tax=Nonomuraea sp. SYSU D8015 TaxID=2593644 RepID=UPI001CB70924|nr:J domain-containing protein [Nonomuraea sp. SYSU D8015]
MPVRRDGERPRRDHYTVLGVEPSASPAQITSAYRRLLRVLHPDARPAEPAAHERFAEVLDAYATLRDPARRAAYDAGRAKAAPGPSRDRSAFAGAAGPEVTIVAPPDPVLLRVAPARFSPGRRPPRDVPLIGYDDPWTGVRVWCV